MIAIKEGIRLERQQNLQTKVMVTLFGLFAEIEGELIFMRTKGSSGRGMRRNDRLIREEKS